MYFGDYHTHTTFSHGTGSVEDNVASARAIGLKEIAITDHGFGHMAYAVKRSAFPVMRARADELNKKHDDIKVLVGLECNLISSNGDIDLKEGEEKLLDIIVCGFHKGAYPQNFGQAFSFALPNLWYSAIGKSGKKNIVRNTDAYIKMLEKHKIDIISHMNYAICADAVEVAKACKHFGTLVELNGKRVNLTDAEIEKMIENGVDFIVDSDAHSPGKVGDFSVPQTVVDRLHIPAERIANFDKKPVFRSGKK